MITGGTIGLMAIGINTAAGLPNAGTDPDMLLNAPSDTASIVASKHLLFMLQCPWVTLLPDRPATRDGFVGLGYSTCSDGVYP